MSRRRFRSFIDKTLHFTSARVHVIRRGDNEGRTGVPLWAGREATLARRDAEDEEHRRGTRRLGWWRRNKSQWASSPRRGNSWIVCCSPLRVPSRSAKYHYVRQFSRIRFAYRCVYPYFEIAATENIPFVMEESLPNNVRSDPAEVFRNNRRISAPRVPLTFPFARLKFLKSREMQIFKSQVFHLQSTIHHFYRFHFCLLES